MGRFLVLIRGVDMIYKDSMEIIKMSRQAFMSIFGSNDYDYNSYEDFLIIRDNDSNYPYSVYVRHKGDKHFVVFASEEFNETQIKCYI
jgi:hypothetical protein